MTDVSTRNRVSKGVSTGGQFATESKPEATGVSLGVPSQATAADHYAEGFESDAFLTAAEEYQDSRRLKRFVDELVARHPKATHFYMGEDSEWVEVRARDADGNEAYDAGELTDAVPYDSRSFPVICDEDRWASIADARRLHEERSEQYRQAQAQAQAAVEDRRASKQYATELTREIAIQHRLFYAEREGEDYDRLDAEEFVDQFVEDDLHQHVSAALNGAADGEDVDVRALTRALEDYNSGFDLGWESAVEKAVTKVRSGKRQDAEALEVSRGSYVNTYLSQVDGTPVVDVMTNGGEFSGPIRVHVNDGVIFDRDPEG